ncbi:hypothetical protein Pint_19630 [Pistacia integerrima]|uniref:Uncharacterized protein n=1 Tax=Pistacia integerrima TaxID=434235 RepID=A0ACC0XDK1_9ROSI|nr:hypothetical protein Pint_19630 [Pistacia integerrima]
MVALCLVDGLTEGKGFTVVLWWRIGGVNEEKKLERMGAVNERKKMSKDVEALDILSVPGGVSWFGVEAIKNDTWMYLEEEIREEEWAGSLNVKMILKFHNLNCLQSRWSRVVSQIEVKFDIDANGILSVTAVDSGTGKKQDITITGASILLSDEVELSGRFGCLPDREATKGACSPVKEKVDGKLQGLKDAISGGSTQGMKDFLACT